MHLRSHVRAVPNHPATRGPGWDINSLLGNAEAFATSIEMMADHAVFFRPTHILGLEAGGFIFASALAHRLDLGLIVARQPGKLAPPTIQEPYGDGRVIEIQEQGFSPVDRILIVDDLLSSTAMAVAARTLIHRAGAQAVGLLLLAECGPRERRDSLEGMPIMSIFGL